MLKQFTKEGTKIIKYGVGNIQFNHVFKNYKATKCQFSFGGQSLEIIIMFIVYTAPTQGNLNPLLRGNLYYVSKFLKCANSQTK